MCSARGVLLHGSPAAPNVVSRTAVWIPPGSKKFLCPCPLLSLTSIPTPLNPSALSSSEAASLAFRLRENSLHRALVSSEGGLFPSVKHQKLMGMGGARGPASASRSRSLAASPYLRGDGLEASASGEA